MGVPAKNWPVTTLGKGERSGKTYKIQNIKVRMKIKLSRRKISVITGGWGGLHRKYLYTHSQPPSHHINGNEEKATDSLFVAQQDIILVGKKGRRHGCV